ncbi:MAG TPA: glutamine-hydrolyzing GMP synthase [Bacteroidales bacterium]|jgi:GMP synthase (glutamine-hydrolysing)|nr:glutamine-hydrolyzing GMP synthase [Bacteroidales bacterium]
MQEKIVILDFGSPTTQLIGRRVRELNCYCEIFPYHKFPVDDHSVKGVILSGGPKPVNDLDSPGASASSGVAPSAGASTSADVSSSVGVSPSKGEPFSSNVSNPFVAKLNELRGKYPLLAVCPARQKGLHGDFPAGFPVHAPELFHAEEGKKIVDSFLTTCGVAREWTPASFIATTVRQLKEMLGDDKVILALSGGVDSSVAAVLLNRAIGKNLTCIFVDHGLLRKNEFETVLENYEHLGLNVIGVDAKEHFYRELQGVTDPEQKRKIIGKGFIDLFESEAKKLEGIQWLAQGTIYPDIIESISLTGTTIKSHHNVGGLPEKMHLKLCEPLKMLFKDEVRAVGLELGMAPHLIHRHPFPGPGLGIRILGEITPEKVRITQEADAIFISHLRSSGLYDRVWQAAAILLPVRSVGVTGGERTYEYTIALRAVSSIDAMTADWVHLPYDFLATVSNEIIHQVKGVNRVVYDISSKPPATIEWE